MSTPVLAEQVKLKMVFIPASEKGDDKDYVNLINIIENLTSFTIEPIKVTDYNAALQGQCGSSLPLNACAAS